MNNIRFFNKGKEVLTYERAIGYMLGTNSLVVQVDDKNAEVFSLSAFERISIESIVEEVPVPENMPDNVVTLH
jgi:hypothetical protein